MKYKIGDLVRIKSKTWWDGLEKDKDSGNFEEEGDSFTTDMAIQCCGAIGRVISTATISRILLYCVQFNDQDYWRFYDDWIEGKVEGININLKQMRNEI